ncbi:MAG: hypothetical protein HGB12_04050 [Bacteroidetes bacterium]|nr:hypothetical protein [Bacteroidota bacterium]
MKVLLDTNIIIHREANTVVNPYIGLLFNWFDRLHYSKCIHPLTMEEINRYNNADTVKTLNIKLDNYYLLKTVALINDNVLEVSNKLDNSENDRVDTGLINEVYCERVDFLITEDNKIHKKAELLSIGQKVFKINDFINKVTSDNPELIDYKVLSVKKVHFGNINVNDPFFDNFRGDYQGFEKWFNSKSEEFAYVCYNADVITAFLYLKIEDIGEDYSNHTPVFSKNKRLKIGTFKIVAGIKLAERFLFIIFDNARKNKVSEIYVTIFDKDAGQTMLIALLEEWGFNYYGVKMTSSGEEKVYVRSMENEFNQTNPKLSYPYLSNKGLSKANRVFIVPIYPQYHTELFPDSKLNTEDAANYIENLPHRNAICKSYISHSHERNLNTGDIIVFYRTGETTPKIYTSVTTTIGIIDNVFNNIPDFKKLLEICKKRTVLTSDELKEYWNRYGKNKPFVVNFLYAYSFKKRATLKQLLELGVIKDLNDVPRGFKEIDWDLFIKLVKFSGI